MKTGHLKYCFICFAWRKLVVQEVTRIQILEDANFAVLAKIYVLGRGRWLQN